MAQMIKASAFNEGDPGSIPGWERSSGERNGNPLQYSCLENSMDGGASWATVPRVTKSRIRLSNFTFTFTFTYCSWRFVSLVYLLKNPTLSFIDLLYCFSILHSFLLILLSTCFLLTLILVCSCFSSSWSVDLGCLFEACFLNVDMYTYKTFLLVLLSLHLTSFGMLCFHISSF